MSYIGSGVGTDFTFVEYCDYAGQFFLKDFEDASSGTTPVTSHKKKHNLTQHFLNTDTLYTLHCTYNFVDVHLSVCLVSTSVVGL